MNKYLQNVFNQFLYCVGKDRIENGNRKKAQKTYKPIKIKLNLGSSIKAFLLLIVLFVTIFTISLNIWISFATNILKLYIYTYIVPNSRYNKLFFSNTNESQIYLLSVIYYSHVVRFMEEITA